MPQFLYMNGWILNKSLNRNLRYMPAEIGKQTLISLSTWREQIDNGKTEKQNSQ